MEIVLVTITLVYQISRERIGGAIALGELAIVLGAISQLQEGTHPHSTRE